MARKNKTLMPRRKSSSEETVAESVASSSGPSDHATQEEFVEFLIKRGIALKGNGQDEELNREQLDVIQELYDRVASYRDALPAYDRDWCDYECVRRYLVARGWDLEKAQDQLIDTLQWRARDQPASKEFWQSSKSFANPHALCLRIVGWDKDGRPIVYTRFSEATDRFDAYANLEHIMLCLEASAKVVKGRVKQALNATADTRQSVWVIDFDGFGLRDQNPKTSLLAAALLQHFPEMLNLVVLIDAPFLFNGLWKLASPLLDERVKRKFMFVKGKDADSVLREWLGAPAAEWISNETKDSAEQKREKGVGKRKYWQVPDGPTQHDGRGLASYVNSELYIRTPGDAYEDAKQGKLNPGTKLVVQSKEELKDRHDDDHVVSHVTRPTTVKTIYSGTF